MANPFTAFAFPASGSNQVNRTLPDRITEIKNVKDWGAKGDGVTDDSTAIMAAFNWTTNNSRGTLFFPPGTYYVSQPLDFTGSTDPVTAQEINVNLQGVGPLSTITGNFSDYVIKRGGTLGYAQAGASGNHTIESLAVVNTNATGGGIRWGVNTGGAIRNVSVTANLGITLASYEEDTSVTSNEVNIENAILSPGSNPTNSVGIMTPTNGQIANCSIIGFQTGAMGFGHQPGQHFNGCRFELCGTGFAPGQLPPSGTAAGEEPALVFGCYFKNCGKAIDFSGGSANAYVFGTVIESTNATVFGSTPASGISGSMVSGHFKGVYITGQFSNAGIDLSGVNATEGQPNFYFWGVTVNNTGTGAQWKPPTGTYFQASNNFIACNFAPVWAMSQLPAPILAVSSASWTGGTATIVTSTNIGQLSTANINVSGISPSGYNGVFTGATIVPPFSISYTVANPGGSGGAGSVIFNPLDANSQPSAKEGDCFNVSDASTNTWSSNPIGGGSTPAKVRWQGAATNWSVIGV